MYKTETRCVFYYCTYNFDLNRWEYTKKFETRRDMLTFIAKHWKNETENSLYPDQNFSGHDTMSTGYFDWYNHLYIKGSCYFRNKCFMDKDWRIIDMPEEGIEWLIPLSWNKKVRVERYEQG